MDVSVAMLFFREDVSLGPNDSVGHSTHHRLQGTALVASWNKHHAKRDQDTPLAATDVDGFHCVLPAA